MITRIEDPGAPPQTLRAVAWFFGILSGVGFLRLLMFIDANEGVRSGPGRLELIIWLALVIVCAIFSAACAVLAGVKNAEHRLAQRLQSRDVMRPGGPDAPTA